MIERTKLAEFLRTQQDEVTVNKQHVISTRDLLTGKEDSYSLKARTGLQKILAEYDGKSIMIGRIADKFGIDLSEKQQ